MSLIAESPGFIQVFSDGTVNRIVPHTVPPSANFSDQYASKDLTLDPSKPITARLFLPSNLNPNPDTTASPPRLPLLIYFHGGGFCIGSTTWLGYHIFLGNLSTTAKTIILSVDYRLAPENKLPTAYDDGYTALEWLSRAKDSEPWLGQADLSRVFLSGDSAGGNIAHHVAVKAMENDLSNVRVKGLLPIHPFFGSEVRTELEAAEASLGEVAMNDMFWNLSLPEGAGRDFYGCNFEKKEAEWSRFPAVVVFVAGGDFLKERGVMYAEFLKKKGVKMVSLVEAEGESHVFHVWNPKSEAANLLEKQMTSFIQSL